MEEVKRGKIAYLDAVDAVAAAASVLKKHRIALIDDLNRLTGPPSTHMLAVQQEFIADAMDPAEAAAFARYCYSSLVAAVASTPAGLRPQPDGANIHALPGSMAHAGMPLPCYNRLFFSTIIPSDIMEQKSVVLRQNLVNRYNDAVGPPGAQVSSLQKSFLTGALDRSVVARYIQQCEEMIEARMSLRPRRCG